MRAADKFRITPVVLFGLPPADLLFQQVDA